MLKTKDEYPRSFYFKIYKAFCKLLDVTCLCYGKMSKNDKLECIYGIDRAGLKHKLSNKNRCILQLRPSRREKDDIQKAIVKRIMKELEVSDICLPHEFLTVTSERHVIPRNICCEKLAVEYDLNI